MNVAFPDAVHVVNGPEDGASYSLPRRVNTIGSDRQSDVALRQDEDIYPSHAELALSNHFYRVRSLSEGSVRVNGRRVGRIFPRRVADGDVMQVGNTELIIRRIEHPGERITWLNRFPAPNARFWIRLPLIALSATIYPFERLGSLLLYLITALLHALRFVGELLYRHPRAARRILILAVFATAYVMVPSVRSAADAGFEMIRQYLYLLADMLRPLME